MFICIVNTVNHPIKYVVPLILILFFRLFDFRCPKNPNIQQKMENMPLQLRNRRVINKQWQNITG